MFSRDQLDRYSRHILLPGVGAAGQTKLLASSVLVVGAGGLGSPVLLYLAAAGVGKLGVADMDRVEASNLQRQVIHDLAAVGRPKTESARERIMGLNPDVQVTLHEGRLEAGNAAETVRGYDLVADGSDNFATRYLLSDVCVFEGKPLVYGAMAQFEGQVSVFHARDAAGELGPCYRCLYPEPPSPGSVLSCAEAGVFGALPGAIGSIMAAEAIKALLGLGETLAGTLLHYDALYAHIRRVRLARDPGCPVCGDAPSIRAPADYEAFCG
ncbi:MAG: molybdopterin-synthase adenylyltransferase MoeB [Deinococcota bacterium]|nr:molybdopterin-synthase adenylyltransferase MoeB [Deinococcota bacterium]